MSSRTAAARKRLVPAEETRPSDSKGFFSRSKSAAANHRVDFGYSYPSPPLANATFQPTRINHNSQGSASFDLTSEYPQQQLHVEHSRTPPYPQPNSLLKQSSSKSPSGLYPSPPLEDLYSNHIVRLDAPSPHVNIASAAYQIPGYTVSGSAYIEASYQPPPPPRANVQRPPPTSPGKVPISPPSVVTSPLSFDSHSSFPPPPRYPPPVPSTHASPTSRFPSPANSPHHQSSLLLQTPSRVESPTPTELPTYSNSESYLSAQISRSPLQVSIQNSPISAPLRPEYQQYSYNPTPSYPSLSASTNPPRHTPSPLRQRNISSAEQLPPTSNDGERRPWYRNLPGNQSGNSNPSSPTRAASQLPAAAPPRLRPPASIASGSSGSSGGKSPSSAEAPQLPPATFVFPGSRSVARPKVSKKTGTPQIKIIRKDKSRRRGSSDVFTSPTSIPDGPSIPGALSSPITTASSPVSDPGSNGMPHAAQPAQSQVFSETASAFSDDSGELRPRKLSTTSSSRSTRSSPASSPGTFVFPSSRSRAAPSRPPPTFKMKSMTRTRSRQSSNNSIEGEKEERSRFMGILLKKKKKVKAPDSSGSNPVSSESEFSGDNNSSLGGESGPTLPDTGDTNLRFEGNQETINIQCRERAKHIKSRIGNYPLDPYDSVLLDNDRHTGELLTRLNPTGSPSFHNYGNTPPNSVLDLGCGQGHWVVDAAIAWKGYGTKVTGYDMVDISKGLLPWAVEQGVTDNIRFVRGNFLKQRLPFGDNSFDLVRMSCLALCITSDSWVFVLQEVCRVLMVGGRLELIDDLIFFPYGKSSSTIDDSSSLLSVESVAPRLDITIPSSTFTTFSIYDGDTNNPGLGFSLEETEPEDFYDLYGVEEEPDVDDTATINGDNLRSTADASFMPRPTSRRLESLSSGFLSLRSWNRACATSKDLEALFEHMLMHKFGVHKDPSDFILELMKEVLGHAREIKTMHITLAPPDNDPDGDDGPRGRQNGLTGFLAHNDRSETPRAGGRLRSSSASRRQSMGLSQSPGLVLWPSTFIPMDQSEIEIHASKHLRMLLSCKNFLLEHAVEATDDEEIDEESVLEALWEYEGFLRHRFNPPPPSSSSASDHTDPGSDTASIRGSIAESVSSDGREAMWEIQSEFRQRFVWPLDRLASRDRPATPSTPKIQDNTPIAPIFPAAATAPSPAPPVSPPAAGRARRDTVVSAATTAAPLYSREELTHVRTFRIYEAIKIDDTIFGTAI